MASLDNFLEWFHHGSRDEYDKILKVFKKTRNFLKLIINRNKQSDIDIEYIPLDEFKTDPQLFKFLAENGFLENINYDNLEDPLKNYYLLWFMEKDTNGCLEFICDNILTDVQNRSDGYWLSLRDRDELSEFFEKGSHRRDYSPKSIASQVFSEDGLDYGRYSDTTEDVYSDVIDVLNPANIQILASYIMKAIGNQDLNIEDYADDFFHDLMASQGREDFFQITDNDVLGLIGDSGAMNELLNGDLSDLNSELYSIHNNAYNAAYEDEVYNAVMGGLDEFFSSKIVEESKIVNEKTRYYPYIKIRDCYGNVLNFLNSYEGYSDTLDYYGSYTEMMKQLIYDGTYDAIDFHISDYGPSDYNLIDKNINEFFADYI